MSSAPTRIVPAGVLAGAYLRGDKRRAFLVHAVVLDAQDRVLRVLCGGAAVDNICHDSGYDPGPVTCERCRRRAMKAAAR